mmetsp:Transcript_40253/g.84243  ORF Transcript_40253/g.84243 Transcript_40253/m.84243 type:complete len:255 (-) Transcript_40253:1556-2320(-)
MVPPSSKMVGRAARFDDSLGTMARAMSVNFSSLSTERSSPFSLFSEYSFNMVLTLSSNVSCCCSIMTRCSSIFSSRSFVLRARRRSASSADRCAMSVSSLAALTSLSNSSFRSMSFPSTASYSSILASVCLSSSNSPSRDFILVCNFSIEKMVSRACRFSSASLASHSSSVFRFLLSSPAACASHSASSSSRDVTLFSTRSILASCFLDRVFFSRSSMSILTLYRRLACSSSFTWLISSSSSFSNSSDMTICSN